MKLKTDIISRLKWENSQLKYWNRHTDTQNAARKCNAWPMSHPLHSFLGFSLLYTLESRSWTLCSWSSKSWNFVVQYAWCAFCAMLRSWSWLRTILSNWEYAGLVFSWRFYNSIAIGCGSSSSCFPPLVPASWSFALTSIFAPWSRSTSHVLPILVNPILCIFSVETWFRISVDSSSSPSTSTPKCSMNLEMSTTYGSLKSMSLLPTSYGHGLCMSNPPSHHFECSTSPLNHLHSR